MQSRAGASIPMASSPMSMRKRAPIFACLLMICAAPAYSQTYGIGHVVSEKDIAPWNIDVSAEGSGLPAGKGSVAEGKKVYETNCIACHGVNGQGKPADQLVGGQG